MFFKTGDIKPSNTHHDRREYNKIIQILQAQIKQLADPMNYELQNYWNWRPQVKENKAQIRQISAKVTTCHSDDEKWDDLVDSAAASEYNCRSINSESALSHTIGAGTGNCIELSVHSDPQNQVVLEVVIADLHDTVIESCDLFFSQLKLPIVLKQAPIQQVLLETYQTPYKEANETKVTFVLYGGYGNGMVNSALQKQLFDVFPDQMDDLRLQAMEDGYRSGGSSDEHEINMINRGEVWVNSSSLALPDNTPLYLISCAAYPRNQTPSEGEHVRSMFQKALELALAVFSTEDVKANQHYDLKSSIGSDDKHNRGRKTIRIITHAMGSFVGHEDPSVFSWGLAQGLNDFVRIYR